MFWIGTKNVFMPGTLGRGPAQTGDHRADRLALVLRRQHQEHAGVIRGSVRAAGADGGIDIFNRLVLPDDIRNLRLTLDHCIERGVGRGFRADADEPGVLSREEALRYGEKEPYRPAHAWRS